MPICIPKCPPEIKFTSAIPEVPFLLAELYFEFPYVLSVVKMSGEVKAKGYTGQENPEVWNLAAMPEQPKEKKPGQLTPEEVRAYFEEVKMPSIVRNAIIVCGW